MCVCVSWGLNSQVAGCGRVSRRTLGRKVKVRVGAVQEGFPPLAVREVGLDDPARTGAGLGVQGAAAHRQSILHVETEQGEATQREL